MKTNSELMLKIIDAAKFNLKKSEEFLATFFVGTDTDLKVIGAPFTNEQEKEMTARSVKKIAQESKATFVVFICPSYILKDPDAVKEYSENKSKYESISKHPMAKEVLLFTLETQYGSKIGVADILPGREMGVIEWLEGEFSGRFTDILGQKPTVH